MSDEPDWIDELYAEGKNELPPPALDEKIRAAARQPARHPWYRSPGRLTALATAASIVIAVSVLYLETEQPAVDAPVMELESRALPSADSDAGILSEEINGTLDAAKAETAARKSTRHISNEPAEAPAAAAAPAAVPADRLEPTAPDQQPQRTGSTAALRAMEQDLGQQRMEDALVSELSHQAALLEEEPTAELARLCGALPGTEASREITSDSAGWLVTVTVGSDVRTWRCVDGAWLETTSEQQ